MIIGIDPGTSGAVALLGDDGGLMQVDPIPHYWEKMKTKSKSGNFRRKRRIDMHRAYIDLLSYREAGAKACYIEKVQGIPNMGSSSTFNFGEAYGIIQALAVAAGFQLTYVTPQAWKKSLALLRCDKPESIVKARTIFDVKDKIDHNQADACLIAYYGFKQLQA